MVARTYLDSSAIVRWITREPGWEGLAGYLESHPEQFSSRIAEVEVGRALHRLPDPDSEAVRIRASAVLGRIGLIELTPLIASTAAAIGPATLRSLDAIHLASYLALRPDVETLVTYDLRLIEAVRTMGGVAASP